MGLLYTCQEGKGTHWEGEGARPQTGGHVVGKLAMYAKDFLIFRD